MDEFKTVLTPEQITALHRDLVCGDDLPYMAFARVIERAAIEEYERLRATSVEPTFWYVDGPDVSRLCASYEEAAALAYDECTITKLYVFPIAAQQDAADAARYRFIRDQFSPATVMLHGVDTGLAGTSLDEEIDDAMQRTGDAP